MKIIKLTTILTIICIVNLFGQTKKDGTPDMRYSANKQLYGNSYPSSSQISIPTITNSYSAPSYSTPKTERNYQNGGQYRLQDGYMKSNGTYVSPHIKTTPDNNPYNNYKPKF